MASFVRLDNDVISSVGPYPSARWSEGLETDNFSAGMCHFCSQKLLKVSGNNEYYSTLS